MNFCGLINARAILVEKQLLYYLTKTWGDKGLHIFEDISLKVNLIRELEFELVVYQEEWTTTFMYKNIICFFSFAFIMKCTK